MSSEKKVQALSKEQLEKVSSWLDSKEGQEAVAESQRELTDGAVKKIEGYSCVDSVRLKEPYTL